MIHTEDKLFKINLTPKAHQIAKEFATKQSSREKVKQVYLNTLAVQAVNSFVQWFEFTTDLEAGDSWNFVIMRFQNVADLVLPNIGTIECIPVILSENNKVISISPEVQEDRIAYVFVGFEEKLDQCYLLGFYRSNNEQISEINLDKLQIIEELIDYLSELENYDEVLRIVEAKIANTPRNELIKMLEKCRILDPDDQEDFLLDHLPELAGEKSTTTKSLALLTLKNTTNVNDDSEEDKWINLVDELLPKLKEIWGQ